LAKDVETSKSTEIVKNLMESRNQLLEELCEIVMNSNNSKIARQRIANAVTSIIDNLSVRSEKIEELENQVNDMYDNLFIRFRSDMPNLKEADYRLYLFLILRISNSAISLFLKEDKINAVYDRKRRLKDKIKKLDKVKSKEYLSYIT
jgi:molybdopterin-binding protein